MIRKGAQRKILLLATACRQDGVALSYPCAVCRAEAVRCLGLYSMLPDSPGESPVEAVAASRRVSLLRTALVFDPAPAVQEAAAQALCDLALLRCARELPHKHKMRTGASQCEQDLSAAQSCAGTSQCRHACLPLGRLSRCCPNIKRCEPGHERICSLGNLPRDQRVGQRTCVYCHAEGTPTWTRCTTRCLRTQTRRTARMRPRRSRLYWTCCSDASMTCPALKYRCTTVASAEALSCRVVLHGAPERNSKMLQGVEAGT